MANNANLPDFNYADLINWTPYEPGSCDLLPFDGAVIMDIRECKAKSADGDPTKCYFEIGGVADDEDCKGSRLVARVHYSGHDKNGDPLGRQWGDFLYARGITPEEIRQRAAQGETLGKDVICKAYTNPDPPKKVAALIGSEMYQGQRVTRITGFIPMDKYNGMGQAAKRRSPQIKEKGAAAASGGMNMNLGNLGGGGVPPPPNTNTNATQTAAAANLPRL